MSRLFDSFGDSNGEPNPPGAASRVESAGLWGDDPEPLEGDAFGDATYAASEPAAAPLAVGGTGGTGDAEGEDKLGPDDLPSPYEIPNFEQDERDLNAYEDALRRQTRQAIATGEAAIQTSFAQKREQLQREVKNARSFEEERRATALHTTRQYANAYPHRVDKRGITPPSFFESLLSFGRAGRLYRAAFVAGEALEQLRAAMRKREEALGALEGQLQRALYLKEEQVKKNMESDAGLADFHERAEIKPLWRRVEKVRAERAEFALRHERGGVPDEELRDRAMAEQKLTYATLPMMGVIIAKVARFGRISYLQMRDLEKKESLLSYDPRLDPLRNCVFDIYSVANTVAAKLKRNDNGTAFRVADHFKACWRNQDKAEELYSQHRAALREDRGLAKQPPRDDNEAEIIERLAALAALVEGAQGRNIPDPLPAALPNTPIRPT